MAAAIRRGRPPRGAERRFQDKLTVAWQFLGLGMTAAAVAQFNGIGRTTVYREVNEIRKSKHPRAVALMAQCREEPASARDAG